MFKSFEIKGKEGIQTLLAIMPIELSRFWKCADCGRKIYQVKVTALPQYNCLCGKNKWTVNH